MWKGNCLQYCLDCYIRGGSIITRVTLHPTLCNFFFSTGMGPEPVLDVEDRIVSIASYSQLPTIIILSFTVTFWIVQRVHISELINTYRVDRHKLSGILKDLNTIILDSVCIISFSLCILFCFSEVISSPEASVIIRHLVEGGGLELISDIYSSESDETILV